VTSRIKPDDNLIHEAGEFFVDIKGKKEMKSRAVIILIEVESTAALEDIPPFVKNALTQEDDGSTVVRSVHVQVAQPVKPQPEQEFAPGEAGYSDDQ
jgi:hypothetical protein